MSRPVIDNGLKLPVQRIVRGGLGYGRWMIWTWHRQKEPVASISAIVEQEGKADGLLRLSYRLNGKPLDQTFRLCGQPCRFGGMRWLVVCPVTGRLASKLYLLTGAGFQTRHRLGRVMYRTQLAPKAIDRILLRRNRILFDRLKGIEPEFVPKPKWMRWKTFHHWMARLDRDEALLGQHTVKLLARIARLG